MPPDKEITLELKGAPEVTNLWDESQIDYIPQNLEQALVDQGVPESEIESFANQDPFECLEEAYDDLLEKYKQVKKS